MSGTMGLARAFVVAGMMMVAMRDVARGQSPFATRVVSYDPAPGQFVNDSAYNDPSRALGAPEGSGTADGNEGSVVSLGGFGGTLTLGFDHTIEDDPYNPLGLDFIVFGNAFWVAGDEQRRFAECAVVEVSRDANGNGLPDDSWYLMRGTHLFHPVAEFSVRTWDDDTSDPTYPPSFETWVPPGRSGVWQTAGFELPADPFAPPGQIVVNTSNDPQRQGIVGYAEYSPTLFLGDLDGDDIIDDPSIVPEAFYTVPDDPFLVGISPGSGGGDAFDIAWATEPFSGARANLKGIDFIRITTAIDAVHGVLGETSAEVDAVADVVPVPSGDAVPAASTWSLTVLVLGLAAAGTILAGKAVPTGTRLS